MRVAIVQTSSNDDLAHNLAQARDGVAEAAERGAGFVCLPENFAFMRREGQAFPYVQAPRLASELSGRNLNEEGPGEIVEALSDWARQYGLWLLGGTVPEVIEGSPRIYNTSLLFDPKGKLVSRYRKIHLFDVDLGEDGQDSYRESKHFEPGSEVVVAPTPFGGIGLSICYDLRFPELYRAMLAEDLRFITVPSAFTQETGRDHWEVLLRARAIENQAYVIAPAQCGRHSPDRQSYGRSLVISPWGLVLAQAGDHPTVLVADCPESNLVRTRRAVPALKHQKLASVKSVQ